MSIIPATLNGVAVLVGILVPGIVYAAVRTSLQGFVQHDRSIAGRVIQAVMVSVVLDSIYLVLFAWIPGFIPSLPDAISHRPWQLGALTLIFGILVPAFIAYLLYSQARWVDAAKRRLTNQLSEDPPPAIAGGTGGHPKPRWRKIRWYFSPNTGYRKTPTAWDWIAPQKANLWIRVLNADGRWIGGWSTEDTFFSAYPEAKDIYIPEQWDLNEDGGFLQKSESTAGVWLPLEGAQLVEWLHDEPRTSGVEYGDTNE